jgi:hypothetical protein
VQVVIAQEHALQEVLDRSLCQQPDVPPLWDHAYHWLTLCHEHLARIMHEDEIFVTAVAQSERFT